MNTHEELIKRRVYDFDVYAPSEYYEARIDMDLFERLIDNIDELKNDIGFARVPKSSEFQDWNGTKTLLQKMYTKRLGDCRVSYKPTKASPLGRHYSDGYSLQGISRVVRHLLCKDNYIDIDMKNCHPVILQNICKAYNIDCSHISYYIDNRDKCLQELVDKTGLSRDDCKASVLSLMNGGSGKGVFNDEAPEWALLFQSQMIKILQQVTNLPDYEFFKKQVIKANTESCFNLNGKIINQIFLSYEIACVQYAIDYVKTLGITVASNQFDGLLVEKHPLVNNELLCSLSDYVLNKVGIKIQFDFKDMIEAESVREKLKHMKTKKEIKIEEIAEKNRLKEEAIAEKNRLKEEAIAKKKARDEARETIARDKKKAKEIEKQMKEEAQLAKRMPLPDLTDENLGRYFFYIVKDDLKYDTFLRQLYLYDERECLWKPIDIDFLALRFTDVLLPYIDSLIEDLKDEVVIERYEQHKSFICNTQKQRDLIYQMKKFIMDKDDTDFIKNNFNQAKHLFPFQDQVFDFSRCSHRKRKKEDYFTMTTNNEYIEDYDQKWVKTYLGQCLNTVDETYVDSFGLLLGHNLTNDNSIKKIVCGIGEGDNGKTCFNNLNNNVVGGFQCTASKSLFIARENESLLDANLVPLMNKRLTTISEVKEGQSWNTDLLKRISGDDKRFSCRKSTNSPIEEILISSKLFLITNELPFNNDPVFAKRLLCINFSNVFEKDESKIVEIMSKSNDYFSYLCHKASELYHNNFKIEFHPMMTDFTKSIIKETNNLSDFVTGTYVITDNETDKIKRTDVYEKYKSFCLTEKTAKDKILGKKTFYIFFRKDFNLKEKKTDGGLIFFTNIKEFNINDIKENEEEGIDDIPDDFEL